MSPARDTVQAATRPWPVARRTPVSLIVPVFNSETSLRTLHQAIAESVTSPEFDFEIVYVDDASTDGSLAILRDIEKHAANVTVVEHPRNRGQSKAVLTGILTARSQILVTLDDDLQHRPRDISRLLTALEGTGPATLAMGVADALKRPLWRAWAGLGANAVSNLFLLKPLPLQLTTFCAFHRQLCADLDPGSDRDLPLMTALVQAADMTVTIPVHLDFSLRNRSRYSVVSLFRLFTSRSCYYRLPRVLAWFAGASLLMMANDGLLLTQGAPPHPILQALWPVSTMAWLMLGRSQSRWSVRPARRIWCSSLIDRRDRAGDARGHALNDGEGRHALGHHRSHSDQ